ncbi:MAG: Uma2 family endonuclease [Acidobacteria bacterium]|nr:Uma2 family endonuclease [Acidobacteriota bacterium]
MGPVRRSDSPAPPVKLTYDDFMLFPDDGQRHELIDGEHYVTPSPIVWHQELSMRLTRAFLRYQDAHPGGRLFYAPLDCIFTQFDVVEPDLLFITEDQLDILGDKYVEGAPALVVEILSPGTKRVDERIKRDLYDRVGVREYWIVDGSSRALVVYRRTSDGTFLQTARLEAEKDDTLATPLLPEFTLSMAELFAPF